MVTQTLMGSQGVCVGVGDNSTSKPPYLSRQGSLYSLTLDEFQTHLGNVGKPLGSMNLDELVRNVWSVEANQCLGTTNVEKGPQNPVVQGVLGSSPIEDSCLSLSRDLSRKTVEEVWREIQQCKKIDNETNQDKQNTLGEMTLEAFLAQAGVSPNESGKNMISMIDHNSQGIMDLNVVGQSSVSEHSQWMQYQLLPQHQQQHGMMPMFMQGHHVSQGIPDTQMGSPLIGAVSEIQTANRKRVAPGVVVEKTVERRQKRMIKNRESAARSRARKQAYTNELENKISRLEEENERLRRMREVEKALPSAPSPQPKHQLRRTSSALF